MRSSYYNKNAWPGFSPELRAEAVGGFPYATDDAELLSIFKRFGASDAEVIYYRENSKPAGYGFVTIHDSEQAEAAIKALDGTDYCGRRLGVEIARSRRAA